MELEVREALVAFFAPVELPPTLLPPLPALIVTSLIENSGGLLLAIANRLDDPAFDASCTPPTPKGPLAARSKLFRAVENIGRFHQACLDKGLKRSDVISPTDMENPRHYRRVLIAIATALQLADPLKKPHQTPSTPTTRRTAISPRHLSPRGGFVSPPSSPASSSGEPSSPRPEKTHSVIFREKCHKTRPSILKEILDTETAYVESLTTIVDLFLQPLETSQLLKEAEMKGIFANIREIRQAQASWLSELSGRYANRDFSELYEVAVGDLFLQLGSLLPMYSSYASNQPTQNSLIHELLSSNKQFAAFLLATAEEDRCRGLTFNAFLIQPVQRLCRYPLLLGELIKNTPRGHPDSEQLATVLASVEAMVLGVNEEKRQVDTQIKIAALEKALGTQLGQGTNRLFIREARLKLLLKGVARHHQFVLFSDILLIIKVSRKGQKQRLRSRLELKDTMLTVLAPNSIEEFPFVLELGSEQGCTQFAFNSEAERSSWERQLKQQFREYQKVRVQNYRPSPTTSG